MIHDFDPTACEGKLPSPCISICVMNETTGLCDGCLRTIDEIVAWGTASEGERLQIWHELKRRAEALW